jgi:hypothetical protein
MRQYVVLVQATDSNGDQVEAIGGQVVPGVGGALVVGVIGESAEVAGETVRFLGWSGSSQNSATALRIARPTGDWIDDEGPGTASTQGLSAAEKGLPELSYLGEFQVLQQSGDEVLLASSPPALEDGDLLFLVGADDLAGSPGWLYAKTLLDANGLQGVAHFRAVAIASDNRIAAGGSNASVHRFPDVDGLTITASLIRRRIAQTVARPYGWPLEDEVVGTAEESQ